MVDWLQWRQACWGEILSICQYYWQMAIALHLALCFSSWLNTIEWWSASFRLVPNVFAGCVWSLAWFWGGGIGSWWAWGFFTCHSSCSIDKGYRSYYFSYPFLSHWNAWKEGCPSIPCWCDLLSLLCALLGYGDIAGDYLGGTPMEHPDPDPSTVSPTPFMQSV